MSIGTLTYDEAIAELNNPANSAKYSTKKGLESLVERVSVQDVLAAPDARTYTYSAELGKGLHSNDLAKTIAKSEGANARIIDRSPAAKFLLSADYQDAVKRAYKKEDPHLTKDQLTEKVTKYLYHGKNGPWANRSAEFIKTTKGSIVNLTPNATKDRVWAKTEFARELSNPDIREINNIPKKELVDFKKSLENIGYSDKKATDIVRQAISVQSHIELADVKYAKDKVGNIIWTDAAVKLANGKNIPIPSTAVSVGTIGDLTGPMTYEKMKTSFPELQNALKRADELSLPNAIRPTLTQLALSPETEKLTGKDVQKRLQEELKAFKAMILSPEKIGRIQQIEQNNLVPKPESIKDKSTLQMIESRIEGLKKYNEKLNGLESMEFTLPRKNIYQAVKTREFQQQISQAKQLVQSNSRGMER